MSTGAVIAVVVAVVVILALVAAWTMLRGGGGAGGTGLKRRFGPEYERTLDRHDGDTKATRQELSERVKRYGGIEPRRVDPQERERYVVRWAEVQARFVDEPGRAVTEADRLIAGVAADRGFPDANSPEHFDALSVHYPHEVQGYRQAHALAEHAGAGGRRATEDLRQALVAARELFDELAQSAGEAARKSERTPAPTAAPVPAATADADSDSDERTADVRVPDRKTPTAASDQETGEDGTEHRRPLSDRFAALTGSSRRGHHTDET
jgi:hypothetical protein